MPAEKPTPDIAALAAAIQNELVFGQVFIQRQTGGFELRHIFDKATDAKKLKVVEEEGIRPLAQFTSKGMFRPLKSAPNLPGGWRIVAEHTSGLGVALDRLYPGAVADWFSAQQPQPPITSYREFTARQTGMYRITTHLDDATTAAGIRACCHAESCLKCRRWSVEGLAPDNASEKSVIPCLEPCAILLEFARKIARLEQQDWPPAQESSSGPAAECDFDAPDNPRRLRFFLEKARAAGKPQTG